MFKMSYLQIFLAVFLRETNSFVGQLLVTHLLYKVHSLFGA